MRWYITILGALAFIAAGMSSAVAQGTPSYECDNSFDECGTPEQSGGGCGCGGGSILVNNTDLGDTYQFADDFDDDGIEDPQDNCPRVANTDQGDGDGDGIGDLCDNCLGTSNLDQFNIDGDLMGDACDDDMDGDGVDNPLDNCPGLPNPTQANFDGNTFGDACDDDIDGDGIVNLTDPCPMNPSITDPTPDQLSQCFPDDDGDGIADLPGVDKCVGIFDPEQLDVDGDGIGDACDVDIDDDGFANHLDNCPGVPNDGQNDGDNDMVGDSCDTSFCYVVLGDQSNCLDPDALLSVYSPNQAVNTGDPTPLRIFANRQSQAMRYTWSVVSAPEGSSATVDNARGTVTVSTAFQYHFLKEGAPLFVADEPGDYTLKLTVTTVWEDRVSGNVEETAAYTMNLTATGDSFQADDGSAGCQMVTHSSRTTGLAGLLLLGALGALVIRRRRS